MPLEKPLETHEKPDKYYFPRVPSLLFPILHSFTLRLYLILFRVVVYRLKRRPKEGYLVVGHFVNLSPGPRRSERKRTKGPSGRRERGTFLFAPGILTSPFLKIFSFSMILLFLRKAVGVFLLAFYVFHFLPFFLLLLCSVLAPIIDTWWKLQFVSIVNKNLFD